MRKFYLAIASGLLLSFSWPSIGYFPFIFFAFIPLLIAERECVSGKQIFAYSFFSFFLFNLITTYWIYHATLFGAVAAFVINASLMSIVFLLFHKVRRITSDKIGYVFFVFIWISMEYLHLNWQLSWPWLTIGNVFADFHLIVQWYEYTGFLGGSFWVLLLNILFFLIIQGKYTKHLIMVLISVFILPIITSIIMYFNNEFIRKDTINVVIVQPNIDPYNEKFRVNFEDQLDQFISLAKNNLNESTQLLLGPETALLENIWEGKINNSYSIKALRDLQSDFPNLNILIGATTYKLITSIDDRTETSRKMLNYDYFYDIYNSAIFIHDSTDIDVYHKTKLVPGVEKMPFPKLLDPLVKFAVDLGGIAGSLGKDNLNNTFSTSNTVIRPLICYESVYGDLGGGKSNLISIITNDGWWKNTAGYKQHFSYASLRAIENRRWIVRSANTGISGVINEKGDVIRKTDWNQAVSFEEQVSLFNVNTFYNIYGDYIGRIAVFISLLLIAISFTKNKISVK